MQPSGCISSFLAQDLSASWSLHSLVTPVPVGAEVFWLFSAGMLAQSRSFYLSAL